MTAQFWHTVASGFVVMAAYAVIGVAIGALVTHQIAAVVGVLVWMLAVEQMVIPLYPGGRTLDALRRSQLVHAVRRGASASSCSLSPWAGSSCSAYAAVTVVLAVARDAAQGRPVSSARSIHAAGAVCLAAGLVGAGAGIFLAVVSPAGAENFVYPHGARELTGLQMFTALLRVGLIVGLLGLWWSGAVPSSRGARSGRYLALVMMAVLTVVEGLAVTVPRSPTDGAPPAFSVVYAACTALLGVALVAEGLGVARAGAWQGWKRWLPLSLGVWLLLVVLPALALSFDAARWAMSGWLLLFALLGWVLTGQGGSAPSQGSGCAPTRMRRARGAAVVTWVYAAAFGAPTVPIAAYVAQNGRLPRFLDAFTMYGGPWAVPFDEAEVLLLLTAFLVVTLAAAWAAWLVWNGSRVGGVLALALLPAEAAFWYGFALPLPWLLGLARAILLASTWESLTSRPIQTSGPRAQSGSRM